MSANKFCKNFKSTLVYKDKVSFYLLDVKHEKKIIKCNETLKKNPVIKKKVIG